jgi:SAM-dependent methyltransferase
MAHEQLDTSRKRLDRDEWSRYWQRGTVTTFEGHFRDNYDAEIRDFWWRQFEPIPDGGALVDLATGNGALPLLAARYAREHGRSFSILGLDSAALDPARLREARPELAADLDSVTLVGNTSLEDTGLEAAFADLVTSQFGFEYGDTAAGAREAFRILRPGGRLAMILHHAQSAILDQAREGLVQVGLCVEQERLPALARRLIKLLPSMERAAERNVPLSPGARKLRDQMLQSVERLKLHALRPEVRAADAGFIEFLVPTLMRLVDQSRALAPGAVELAWKAIWGEIDSYRLRMADLVSAARSEDGMATIREQLEAAGFGEARTGRLEYGDRLLGWTLEAGRS